ncbi:hypothetical protein AAFF_G00358990 [Aldrovandia affinis]|uniref:Uncharacterized protein n=1 Tax=Aldrovandia affinis TaxID=143900 RepID=A0AAD7SI59_9TELE|nr:hypothetical protein AAFF_G00358990 [Aldrovandia affinis]
MEGTGGRAEIACCQEPALTLQDGQGPACRAGCRSGGLGRPDIPRSHTLRPGCFALQVIKVGSQGWSRFQPDPAVTVPRAAVSGFRQEPPGASTSLCHFSPLPSSARNTQNKLLSRDLTSLPGLATPPRGALCRSRRDGLVGPCCCFHDNREMPEFPALKEIELTTRAPSRSPPPRQPGNQGLVETLHSTEANCSSG